MKLTAKLLSFLHRVFDKNPRRFLALRLSYDGQMTWRVQDAVLTTTVVGGSGQGLSVDLTAYRITDLVNYLASQQGYSVLYADGSELSRLSARVLIDGTGNIATSNGDHLHGYTSPLWAYLEAMAVELDAAGEQIREMLRQMSTRTAEGEWLDEIGSYYGVPRLTGESDGAYGDRIIAEVLRPRSNNVAMEMAIKEFTGQAATVTDVVLFDGATPAYNSLIQHNGLHFHSAVARPIHGLFDVTIGYDLLTGGSPAQFQQEAREIIGRLRAAGTHLRALELAGSVILDAFPYAPGDNAVEPVSVGAAFSDTATQGDDNALSSSLVLAGMSDGFAAPADAETALTVTYNYQHNGTRTHNGAIRYTAGTFQEVLP